MAITITRTPWQDDDGTGTTGTVLNNAVKTDLYNQIDAALAKAAQLAGGNAFTGNQSITGALSISGLLTANGFGNHLFQGAGTGLHALAIQNSVAGPTNASIVYVANDVNFPMLQLVSYSSTYTQAGWAFPNGSAIIATGASGLSFVTTNNVYAMRFYTNSIERVRVQATGEVMINTVAAAGPAALQIASAQATQWGMAIKSIADSPGGLFAAFVNAAGSPQGSITAINSTTVAYGTSSDARLKDDAGRATDVSALRAVVVHDFRWKADGQRARGVFAQEAADVFPRAITVGTDETTDDGSLARPWMTDYSKFVPDLIVGWQQHETELAELRAILATMKG